MKHSCVALFYARIAISFGCSACCFTKAFPQKGCRTGAYAAMIILKFKMPIKKKYVLQHFLLIAARIYFIRYLGVKKCCVHKLAAAHLGSVKKLQG